MAKTIITPLQSSSETFDTYNDELDVVKQHIKNLLLTNPGDRVIRRNKIGIPISNIFFENDVDSGIELIKSYLTDNIKKYFSGISIEYVKEINKNVNSGTRKVDIEIYFLDKILNRGSSVIISNE
jgi:phage baseplate assembly protein W